MFTYKNTIATQTVALYLQLISPVAGIAATLTSTSIGGDWSASSTWVNSIVPSSGDDVAIMVGAQVKIDADMSLQSLTINGTLTFETNVARTITISGNVTINNGGIFQTGSTGIINTHALSIGGNLTNNGILDFSTSSNKAGAGITFTGANNTTFGGSGSRTDILTLTIDKGTTYTPILTLNPSIFTVKASTSGVAAFLNIINGTIQIAGNYTFSSYIATANFSEGSNCGFWLNNPNVTISTTNSLSMSGLFKLTQGTFSVGNSISSSFNLVQTTELVVEGGILNVASRLKGSPLSFTISNGTINVCTKGNSTSTASFSINAKTFTMSGGNIVLNAPSVNYDDYAVTATTYTITGGVLSCSSNMSIWKLYNISGIIPNLQVTGSDTVAITSLSSVVYGNIEVDVNSKLHLDTFKLSVKGNIQNNGSIKAFTNTKSERGCFDFTGSTVQTCTGTGTWGTLTEPINSVYINNTAGILLNCNSIYIKGLYLFKGSITNAWKLTFGNTSTLSIIQYGDNTTPIISGNLDAAPDFSNVNAGLAVFYGKETNARTTGFEIPSNRSLVQLAMIGSNVTLSGGDLNVSYYLDFTSGKMNLGNNNLLLESTITITGANTNGYAVTNGSGRVTRKNIGNTATLFPVGTTTYDPVSITNAGTADDFSVGVTTILDAFAPMPTKYVQRQWNISEAIAGGSNVTLSLTCAAGVPMTNFDAAFPVKIGHYKSNNTWEQIPATMSSMVATGSNITSFSPFLIVNENAILPVELIDFQGIVEGKQNIIRWQTASEKDIKHFVLERRNNYEDFKSLDFVAATGHWNLPQSYQWIDDAPTPLSMYRLKMVDLDGSFEYSKTITMEHAGGNAITILSNRDADEWILRLQNMPFGEGSILIFDIQGKLQYTQKIDNQFIANDIKFSTIDLPDGAYVLVCRILGQTTHQKFVKL
jgi:G8 domain